MKFMSFDIAVIPADGRGKRRLRQRREKRKTQHCGTQQHSIAVQKKCLHHSCPPSNDRHPRHTRIARARDALPQNRLCTFAGDPAAQAGSPSRKALLRIIKEIGIYTLYFIVSNRADAEIMINHEFRQSLPVNKNNLCRMLLARIFSGIF